MNSRGRISDSSKDLFGDITTKTAERVKKKYYLSPDIKTVIVNADVKIGR